MLTLNFVLLHGGNSIVFLNLCGIAVPFSKQDMKSPSCRSAPECFDATVGVVELYGAVDEVWSETGVSSYSVALYARVTPLLFGKYPSAPANKYLAYIFGGSRLTLLSVRIEPRQQFAWTLPRYRRELAVMNPLFILSQYAAGFIQVSLWNDCSCTIALTAAVSQYFSPLTQLCL